MTPHQFQVLVVDDEEIMREFLSDVLRDMGFSVFSVGGKEQVLSSLEARNFDLVITDLRMPDLDGRSILNLILNKQSSARVILMTGYALDASGQEFLNQGAFGFILKPFDIGQIRELAESAFAACCADQADKKEEGI